MRQKTLPGRIKDLLLLGERITNGLEMHAQLLEMTSIPPDEFKRILDRVRKAETALSAAKTAKASAQARATAADKDLTAWLAKARLVVMLARGAKWSEHWIETGFNHGRTNVPKDMESKIALARRLVVFLALQPGFGVSFADVTATHGRSIYTRLIQTRYALEKATEDYTMYKSHRDAAENDFRRALRQVILVFRSSGAGADPHGIAFDLNAGPGSAHSCPGSASPSRQAAPSVEETDSPNQHTVAA